MVASPWAGLSLLLSVGADCSSYSEKTNEDLSFLTTDEQKARCLWHWVAPTQSSCHGLEVYRVQHCLCSCARPPTPQPLSHKPGIRFWPASKLAGIWSFSAFQNLFLSWAPKTLPAIFSGGCGCKTGKVWPSLSFDFEAGTHFRSLTWFCFLTYSASQIKKESIKGIFFFCTMYQVGSVGWLRRLVCEREDSGVHVHLVFWHIHLPASHFSSIILGLQRKNFDLEEFWLEVKN